MKNMFRTAALLALAGAAAPAFAQDSVSNSPGLPGDALDAYAPNVQVTNYIVTGIPFTSSKGFDFQIAPIVKSSKTDAGFFSSLTSAQSISNRTLFNVPFAAQDYATWNGPGFGVNPTENDAPDIETAPDAGNQFAVGQAEFSGNYNGLHGAIVNYDPADVSRLFVQRVVAAGNGLSQAENRSQFGHGTVDASGNIGFRVDDFGVSGPNPVTGNNIFRVDMATRANGTVNFIDNAGGNDAAATTRTIINSPTAHTPPALLPEGVGNGPLTLSANFNAQIAIEGGGTTTAHRTGSPDHRGSVKFSQRNAFPGNASVVASGAILGRDATDSFVDDFHVFGLDANGGVVASNEFILPLGTINDNDTGATFTGSDFVFDHYSSQVAFRGGNAPVALGGDASGNILAAAVGYNVVLSSGTSNPINTIFVARFDPTDPATTTEWAAAAYFDSGPAGGKPVFGAGGAQIGRMASFLEFSQTLVGPSVSAPSFDSQGNIYFVAPILDFGPDALEGTMDDDFDVVLLRGVYDEANFSWNLERMLGAGDVFTGADSNTQFQIQFISLIDSDSISSGAFWSSNVNETPWNGVDPATLNAGDPQALGGLVFSVEIVYDVDNDGDFNDPTAGGTTDPNSADQSYNTLLWVGPTVNQGVPCPADFDNSGDVGSADLSFLLGNWGPGGGGSAADFDNSGSVDSTDLSFLLGQWGPCP